MHSSNVGAFAVVILLDKGEEIKDTKGSQRAAPLLQL